jgi:hypothetical protein
MLTSISVQSVPHAPLQCKVRLLGGGIHGMGTHYYGGESHPCMGLGDCKRHDLRYAWKGYTACQLFVNGVWLPKALEVTPTLYGLLGSEDLSGQLWIFWRVAGEWSRRKQQEPRECTGQRIESYDAKYLPRPFDCLPAVERMYGVVGFPWDVPCPLLPMAELSEGDPPPPAEKTAPKQQERASEAQYQKLRETISAGRKQLFGEKNGQP